MNTKYNELEEVYEVDLKNTSGAELLAIETPNKYVICTLSSTQFNYQHFFL